MKTAFQVRPAGPRPDFRLVVSFLWSEMHDVDSDGNSFNPASRDWTELYLANREMPSEVVDVYPLHANPLILVVESTSASLAARTAFFLARETHGEVAGQEGRYGPYESLRSLLGEDFDLAAALDRADTSVWRRATLEHPYPNLSRS
jgi:hypothetical protein